MKFKFADIKDVSEWHIWWAWRPVYIEEDEHYVWLEYIERKIEYKYTEVGLQTYRTKTVHYRSI